MPLRMEGPPPGIDLSESRQGSIYGAVIALWLLSLFVTGLRFLARRIQHLPLWWDDWFMLLGFLSTSGISLSTVAYVVPHGVGKHVWAVPPDATFVWAKGLFMAFFFYFTAIAAVKASLLCLYWRLFKYSSIRYPIWILAGIVFCWYIAVTIVAILSCNPVSGFWERYSPTNPTHPHCPVDSNKFFDGNAIPNIITDAAILVLPLPFIWTLQLRRSQKVALTGIFALGLFVIIISILRLIYVAQLDLRSPDITWNFIPSETWSSIEPNIAVLCGNLPVLKPILNLLFSAAGMKSQLSQSASHMHSGTRARSRNFLAPKSSNFSLPNSAGASSRRGVWESSKSKEFNDGDEDGNYLFDHASDKRYDVENARNVTGVRQMRTGTTETKAQGRHGTERGKDGIEAVELDQLKGMKGKVHVTTEVSVTEVRASQEMSASHSDSSSAV